VRKKTLQNSATDIHLIFRLRLLPESGSVVVDVYRLVVREIHEREEIVPGVVVAILPLVHDGVIEQLVIQGLAVAATADEIARECAFEETTG